MKKAFVILSLVLGLCAGGYAQMFNRDGSKIYSKGDDESPFLPGQHGLTGNQDGNGAPVGSGALLLIGFGAAYAMSKKKKD